MRLTSKGAARIADEIVVHHSEHGEPVLNMTELENCQFEPSDFENIIAINADDVKAMITALESGNADEVHTVLMTLKFAIHHWCEERNNETE